MLILKSRETKSIKDEVAEISYSDSVSLTIFLKKQNLQWRKSKTLKEKSV